MTTVRGTLLSQLLAILTLCCISPAQQIEQLSAEYLPVLNSSPDVVSVPGKSVFTFTLTHGPQNNHCSQMEIVVVGLTKQSPNVVIFGPSDIGTIFTTGTTAATDTCQITVSGTFIWQQVNARRSPTATDSYQVTTKVCGRNSHDANSSTSETVPVPLRIFATAFTQPGAFQASFKYSPGLNGSADQISTDIDFSPSWKTRVGWIGMSERYKYDSRPNQNPDALISSLTLQERFQSCSWYSIGTPSTCPGPTPTSAPLLGLTIRPIQTDLRLVSFEYAPATAYGNLITAGRIGLPFIFTIHHQPSAFTFTPSLGMDIGGNLFGAPIPHIPSTIVRGTPGGDASLRISYEKLTKYLDKKPITITAKYRAFIPARDELLTTLPSGSGGVPVYTLSSKTRHFAQSDVSIPLTKYVSAGFSYLFGSLPPSFRQFDHNIQISIKAQSQADYEH